MPIGQDIKDIARVSQPAPGQTWSVLDDGRYAFWFDAHTVSDFSKCETFWGWKNYAFAPQTLRPKGPMRACMTIGSWWSRVSELFYKRVAAYHTMIGASVDGVANRPTIMDILMIAGRAWVESDMDAMQYGGGKLAEQYEKFAIPVRVGEFGKFFRSGEAVTDMFASLYTKRVNELRAKAAMAAEKHDHDLYEEQARRIEAQTALPLGALLMAAQYYDQYAEQDMQNWRVIAAEEPFGRHGDVVIGETGKVVVFWQGKPDLVVFETATGVLAPIDQKTKDYIPYNIQTIWKPNNQMAGYLFALRQIARDLGYDNAIVDRCVLSVCGRLQPAAPQKRGTAPKPRFVRVRPTWNVAEQDEWAHGILQKAERLRHIIESQGTAATRNEFQCHIYSGCEYRPLCSQPAGVRPIVIQSDYVKVDPWTPFEDEED